MEILVDFGDISTRERQEILQLIEEQKRWAAIDAEPNHVPRAYGYRRCSHLDSAETGFGLKAQETRIVAYWDFLRPRLEEKSISIQWGRWFSDEAVSAYTLNLAERPEGKKLHCALRRGDHVIFARLERAFRNLRDMQIQMSQWRDRGINIHFATENVDATTAMGQLQLNLMGAMAQWYSEYISERTKEGFEFFKDKPGFHANGRAWMGFRRVTHNGKVTGVVPIPEIRRVMKKIVQLHDKLGLGFREIPDVIGPQLAREGHRNGTWGKHRCWKAYKVEKELVRPAVKAGRFPEC
jgi:DNA invertase Pin-like site-specific DNA recombinase